ncbi:conserved hypothetical protein [Ureaplasma urealyticum serovar 2 str. ATCC 27814]|uniref:DUF4011 domain-containing protein n=1 Tax=Ureaplasma urealyticum TaxID=2130 RepID=UPI00017940DA|nr:DUF4011 domain-containing protein [Ureaplasma urealyticum]EEH02006.1 conserved hypothetical protein [Ureaplasma urealyticum serovar 2 str. ATCC 27814]
MQDEQLNNKVIKQKVLNLLSTDTRDSCIRTRLTKYHLDITNTFNKHELQDFIEGKINVLKIKSFINTNMFENNLKKAESMDDVIDYLQDFNLKLKDLLSMRKINEWNQDFLLYKNERIADMIKAIESEPKKFDYLSREARSIYAQTGVWPLFIAKNFLIGPTPKPSSLNAPLIFIDVEIKKHNDEIFLKRKNTNFIINEKLLSFLKNDFKNNIVSLNEIKNFNYLDIQNLIKKITLKEHLESIVDNNGFLNLKQNEIKEQFNNLFLYDAYVLGIFEPLGGAIKNDLETIINSNIDPFDEEINNTNQQIYNKNYHHLAEENKLPLIQINRPLNIFQKYAIHSALVKNTLIYGPPGTGKSEVIASIIANVINDLKTTLIISEKKAALDVLHERLTKISFFALFIYDTNNDDQFYNNIFNLIEKIGGLRFIDSQNSNQVHDFKYKNNIISNIFYKKIHELKKEIINISSLIKNLHNEKDTNNNNFANYLYWLSRFNESEIKFINDENLINQIKNLIKTYSYTFDEIIAHAKNSYYFFKKYNYEFSKNNLLKFKEENNQLNQLQIDFNLITKSLYQSQTFLARINLLESFLVKNNMILTSFIYEDANLLSNAYVETNEFYVKFNYLLKDDFKKFLEENTKTHSTFLNNLNNLKNTDWPYVFEQYLLTNNPLAKKGMFKKIKGDEKTLLKQLEVLKAYFNNPILSKFNFLFLEDLMNQPIEIFNIENIVYLNNKQLLTKPYAKDLYENVFDKNLSYELILQLKDLNLNSEQYDIINDLIQYQNEVLINYEFIKNTDFFNLCKKLRDANIQFSKNADEIIYNNYLDYLQIKLITAPKQMQTKIKEIAQICRLTKKPNIVKFILKYYEVLRFLFPIWISKPELVSEMLPLINKSFDYGIFDEASQMFLERSYPSIYRCNINIVAGDDKQLCPTNFFINRQDSESDEFELADVDVAESLLDRAKTALWSEYLLKNHYRSNRDDLISFSNENIYNNELHFASKNGLFEPGIEVINVNGTFENDNSIEAQKIVEILKEQAANYKKIIVITFNIKQSELIENLILQTFSFNDVIYQRFENDEIIVTNLENVQGNEADLVILSVTYAKNKEGILRNNYGPLMKKGGTNRLNVAITRAADKMIVVKSIKAVDMMVNINNDNIRTFKNFIAYCDEITQLANQNKFQNYLSFNEEFLTSFEKIILTILKDHKKANQQILHKLKIGNFNIAFALYNLDNQKIDLLVCLEEFNEWKSYNLLEIYDQFNFLMDRGYKTIIINDYEICLNYHQVKNNIIKLIQL